MKPAYRAWLKGDKKMVLVLGWMSTAEGKGFIQVAPDRWIPVEDCVVMAGTGVRDAKGELSEEIFEGDILDTSYEDADESGTEWIESHDVVKYSHEYAWWYIAGSREDYPLSELVSKAIVIGNIYANPEILAKIKDPDDRKALEQELKENSPEDAFEYFLNFGARK